MSNKKRLIDVDYAIDLLGCEDQDIAIKHFLEELPTVDAVEVVRCKDCLYCKDNTVCIRKVKHGGVHSADKVHANFFCAAGKRRTDG